MGVRRISMRVFLVLLAVFIMVPNVLAQESEVCLVYFMENDCDECGLIDSHIDGLINEYTTKLIAIKYNIDIGQNGDIFEAYRYTYGLPSQTPMILFGKNDYLVGMYEIYQNSEKKIYDFITANGTNCPLESGYIPPSDLKPSDLPGQAEILQSEISEEEGDDESDEEDETGDVTETTPEDIVKNIGSVIEDVVESEHFPMWILITAILIIFVVSIGVVFGKRGGKEK